MLNAKLEIKNVQLNFFLNLNIFHNYTNPFKLLIYNYNFVACISPQKTSCMNSKWTHYLNL